MIGHHPDDDACLSALSQTIGRYTIGVARCPVLESPDSSDTIENIDYQPMISNKK